MELSQLQGVSHVPCQSLSVLVSTARQFGVLVSRRGTRLGACLQLEGGGGVFICSL